MSAHVTHSLSLQVIRTVLLSLKNKSQEFYIKQSQQAYITKTHREWRKRSSPWPDTASKTFASITKFYILDSILSINEWVTDTITSPSSSSSSHNTIHGESLPLFNLNAIAEFSSSPTHIFQCNPQQQSLHWQTSCQFTRIESPLTLAANQIARSVVSRSLHFLLISEFASRLKNKID